MTNALSLSTYSDEELSRLIAESIEPFDEREFNMKGPPDKTCMFRWSPKRCWRNGIQGPRDNDWRSRDMVNDPAMTDMLWKTLIQRYDLETACYYVAETRAAQDNGSAEIWNRAVAEAYAYANGLEHLKSLEQEGGK